MPVDCQNNRFPASPTTIFFAHRLRELPLEEKTMTTVFDHIERLKTEYTDQYVIVDETRPELRRFVGMTGAVKTVNMSGRALVEFDGDSFEGWIDIDVDFLKVVDAPIAKPVKEAAKKPAAKKPAAAKAGGGAKSTAAPAKDSGGKAKPAAKMSVEEMLAAARANKAEATTETETAPSSSAPPKAAAVDRTKMSVAEMLAAARGDKSQATAKTETAPKETETAPSSSTPPKAAAVDRTKMSVAEMLAAARAEKSVATTNPDEAASEEPAADEPAAEVQGELPTDLAGILAYCRKVDG
jgi:hypothetical protein